MTDSLKIRQANRDDLPEMQALYADTIRNICKNDYDQEQIRVWTSSVENKARWQEAITRQFFLIAEIEDKMVGFGSLKEGSHIDFMYVHKDYGRRGIADRLFQTLENESKRLGAACLTSDVSKTARPFFEKKGFKVVRENKYRIKGVEIINYRMRKENLSGR